LIKVAAPVDEWSRQRRLQVLAPVQRDRSDARAAVIAFLPERNGPMRVLTTWWSRLRIRIAKWYPKRRRTSSLGDRGERLAARHLRRQGMTLVGRKVRLLGGELDLIAVDGRTIVFVEVKTRQSDYAGHPLEAITDDKRRRLTRVALAYLKRHDLLEYSARFDVIALIWPQDAGPGSRPEIVHIRNAFEPVDRMQMFV
jgi:putative endonuclease